MAVAAGLSGAGLSVGGVTCRVLIGEHTRLAGHNPAIVANHRGFHQETLPQDTTSALHTLPDQDLPERHADAVVAFTRLFHLTAKEEYQRTATNILRFIFNQSIKDDDLRLCKLAGAYTWSSRPPLTFVVVGKPGDDYHSLLQATWRTYFPRLVVLQFESGVDKPRLGGLKFPVTDKPTLYVCIDTLRSDAIDDTATVITKIKDFLRPK